MEGVWGPGDGLGRLAGLTRRAGARTQGVAALHVVHGAGNQVTQLGDAPHAGGQEGLLQRPELQLRVGIRSLIMAQGPAVVGTEVCREGEDTCGGNKADRSPQERSKAPQAMALPPLPGRAGSVSNRKAPRADC